ncbi:MAG: hypothetical protein EOO52_13055 [Gammaproteobacteria bacterium]|nr:MAG: hypothetical protein EOO52_13055 [Gammaproteobacteria bacterium]
MNDADTLKYLLGCVGDMLNGDYDEPIENQSFVVVTWINRAGRSVKTTVNIDPDFAKYLSETEKTNHDLYNVVFDEVQDFVDIKAFQQFEDQTWVISQHSINSLKPAE